MALGTRTKFRHEILIRSRISVMQKFRKDILESSPIVSETPPWFCCGCIITLGPFQEWFFHHNSSLMDISFCSHPSYSKVIAMKFCSNMTPYNGVTLEIIFDYDVKIIKWNGPLNRWHRISLPMLFKVALKKMELLLQCLWSNLEGYG